VLESLIQLLGQVSGLAPGLREIGFAFAQSILNAVENFLKLLLG
jgi:hypothetical protein